MAHVKNNNLTKGLSGKFGDIMFRQIGMKTYAFPTPQRPKKESEKQRSNRNKFKEATQFAHAAMENEEKKAHYKKLAKKLKLPNAYTAAITDYMRKPEIDSVDGAKYDGMPGGKISIIAGKKQIPLESVNVIVSSPDNDVIECGAARRISLDEWVYKCKLTTQSTYTSYRIMVTVTDATGQSVDKTMLVEERVSS